MKKIKRRKEQEVTKLISYKVTLFLRLNTNAVKKLAELMFRWALESAGTVLNFYDLILFWFS